MVWFSFVSVLCFVMVLDFSFYVGCGMVLVSGWVWWLGCCFRGLQVLVYCLVGFGGCGGFGLCLLWCVMLLGLVYWFIVSAGFGGLLCLRGCFGVLFRFGLSACLLFWGVLLILLGFAFVAVLLIVLYIVILVYIARLYLRLFNWCWFGLVAFGFVFFRCFTGRSFGFVLVPLLRFCLLGCGLFAAADWFDLCDWLVYLF